MPVLFTCLMLATQEQSVAGGLALLCDQGGIACYGMAELSSGLSRMANVHRTRVDLSS